MALSPSQKQHLRERALTDTIFMARHILGHNYAQIEWRDENGKKRSEKRTGDEFGVSALTPHKQMADMLDSPSLWKHMEAPRGSYKSTLLTSWAIRKVLADRDLRVLYVMDTEAQAKKKIKSIRDQFEQNKKIIELWGDLRTADWKYNQFTIKGRTRVGVPDPTFAAAGADTNIVGSHYDIIIVDDIVQWSNVRTPEGIQKVRDTYNMLQPILDPGGTMVIVGTRYSDDDLYGTILREMQDEFEILVLGCGMQVEQDDKNRPILEGKAIFPHLTEDVLRSKLVSMGVRDFSSQYCNNCLSGAMQLFHREHFRVCRWDAPMAKYRTFMFTDTATSTDEEACYSVIGVGALDARNCFYLFDLFVGRVPPATYVQRMVDLYEKWDQQAVISKVLMEKTTANQVFRPMIDEACRQRQIRMNLVDIPRAGNSALAKDRRIERLHSRFTDGRFYVVDDTMPRYFEDNGQKLLWSSDGYVDEQGVAWPDGELVREFIRWPATTKKDIPDALADVDHVDAQGSRLCAGEGVRGRIKESKRLARRRGRAAKHTMKVNGIPVDVNLMPASRGSSGGSDKWSKWARRLG